MRRVPLILCFAAVFGCGDESDNPVASNPEAFDPELVGTWLLTASTDLTEQELAQAERTWTMKEDGTLISEFTVDNVEFRATGTWSASGDRLVATFEFTGETVGLSGTFTIDGNTLTIVADDGAQVTYERQ